MEIDSLRSARISVGTWKVAPPTRLDFTSTWGVTFSSLLPDFESALLLVGEFGLHDVECGVEDSVGSVLLSVVHEVIDKFSHSHVVKNGIGKDHTFFGFAFLITKSLSFDFGCFDKTSTHFGNSSRSAGWAFTQPYSCQRIKNRLKINDYSIDSLLLLSCLGTLGTILGATLRTALNTCCIEGSAHDMVANTGKVLHTAAAHHND